MTTLKQMPSAVGVMSIVSESQLFGHGYLTPKMLKSDETNLRYIGVQQCHRLEGVLSWGTAGH